MIDVKFQVSYNNKITLKAHFLAFNHYVGSFVVNAITSR